MNYSVAVWLLVIGGLPSAANAWPVTSTNPILNMHNHERRSVGVAPMVWDHRLAAAADAYAAELARTGRWGHSAAHRRAGQGENLWMGTRGAYSLGEMMSGWTSEKRMFRAGVFPQVVRSGSWHEVGHYTQMIWPATRRVGCSVRSSARSDYLVCRYSSPGNVTGQRVGAERFASR
jgi:hypothetical protein